MKKHEKLLLSISTLFLSTINFASANFLTVIWNLDLFLYSFLIIAVSCIASVLAVDMEAAVKQTVLSFVLGIFAALGFITAPSMIYGRNIAEINAAFALSLGILAKFLLLGLVFCVIGIVIGWYLNEVSSEF